MIALAAAQALRVPRVLAVSQDALALEFIDSSSRKPEFSVAFGRGMAVLHQHRGKTAGFARNNYIGATPQNNEPLDGPWSEASPDDGSAWPEFFLRRRLRYQVRLAVSRGHDNELQHLLDRAETRILEILASSIESPVILHGDLWGGNFIVDESGEACLIDPAVYFGHREAELAMTHLFGGFDASFYAAYEEALPLAEGHDERLPVYQLYHVLNHLNLFGASYLGQSRRILQCYA